MYTDVFVTTNASTRAHYFHYVDPATQRIKFGSVGPLIYDKAQEPVPKHFYGAPLMKRVRDVWLKGVYEDERRFMAANYEALVEGRVDLPRKPNPPNFRLVCEDVKAGA